MVRREVVESKVGRARAWLNDAATTFFDPLDAFLPTRKAGRRCRPDFASVRPRKFGRKAAPSGLSKTNGEGPLGPLPQKSDPTGRETRPAD